jgi:hypothetical protein
MMLTFFENISSDKFSILSQYDNLSLYTYEQMKLILVSWQHRFTGNDIYFDAEWNDRKTRIIIRYQTNTGKFIQIIEEEWLENKMRFVRSDKNI